MTQQTSILTIARQLIANYNALLAATVSLPDADRVYYARRIQEGIDRAQEMIDREGNVGDNSLLHY